MPFSDVWIVFRFWGALFLVGAAAYPLTKQLFSAWHDHGYFFSKAVGMALVTWVVYVLGMARIAPFTVTTIIVAVGAVFVVGVLLNTGSKVPKGFRGKTILIEELFFLGALLFWSWVKAHEPSIRGLEKFMDYGFMQSILYSRFFPPADMWYPPYPINYYYFGHLVTALLTKLSGLDLAYAFNLMLASIFAFTLTMSFSIGRQLIRGIGEVSPPSPRLQRVKEIGGGLLTAFLVTMAGNMQTIYAFTRGYTGEAVRPFWQLMWGWSELLRLLPEGMERYWYANATRFIPYTIHEFPSYSFVVSDVHGHVLSIPFVLLAIGLIVAIFGQPFHGRVNHDWPRFGFYGFLCGVLLMTNALDGPIYMGLFLILFMIHNSKFIIQWRTYWKQIASQIGIVPLAATLVSLPFLFHFKSFVNGIAVNCPLPFLANSRIGPIIFESIEKCQRSPVWMMWLLWGFFVYCGVALIIKKKFTQIERILIIFFAFSILLIIFPEFFYFKDIYPQHFRSNTMFKLGYQAFIMLSIVSGYAIVHFWTGQHARIARRIFFILLVPQLFLVSMYPLFSVRSYFGGLKRYEGLYGLTWLMREYPDDYQAIQWLKSHVGSGITPMRLPVIVEADGDSYTDYERFSAFTGMPTVVGWAVHEWLWRGSYDVVSPRREDVRKIYESDDVEQTRALLGKYGVEYIVVGSIERDKFPALNEEKFAKIGDEVFRSGETVIYEI